MKTKIISLFKGNKTCVVKQTGKRFDKVLTFLSIYLTSRLSIPPQTLPQAARPETPRLNYQDDFIQKWGSLQFPDPEQVESFKTEGNG